MMCCNLIPRSESFALNTLKVRSYQLWSHKTEIGKLPSSEHSVTSFSRSWNEMIDKFRKEKKSVKEISREFIDDSANLVEFAERRSKTGNLLFNMGKYENALRAYSEAIELFPNCSVYYSNRSACHMKLFQFSDALEDIKKAIQLDHKCLKNYIRAFECYFALGEFAAANDFLSLAKKLGLSDSRIKLEEEKLKLISKIEGGIKQAEEKNDFESAIQYMNLILKKYSCEIFKLKRAKYLVLLGRHQEATQAIQENLMRNPRDVNALFIQGMSLYYKDDEYRAFDLFNCILKFHQNHSETNMFYSRAKILKGITEEGHAALNTGKYELACDLFSKALKLDPYYHSKNAKLYYNMAISLMKLSQWNEAIRNCTLALKLNDKYFEPLLCRGACYVKMRLYEEAVNDYQKAYKIQRNKDTLRLLTGAKRFLGSLKERDYYEILGINCRATHSEIKKAYKKKALIHHPDKHTNAPYSVKKGHERIFKEICKAYNVLSDENKKSNYDNFIHSNYH